jgi:hypothetical protein
MEYRQLGRSGFNVPVLTPGTGTFGGKGRLAAWGSTDVAEATRCIDIFNNFGGASFFSAACVALRRDYVRVWHAGSVVPVKSIFRHLSSRRHFADRIPLRHVLCVYPTLP